MRNSISFPCPGYFLYKFNKLIRSGIPYIKIPKLSQIMDTFFIEIPELSKTSHQNWKIP